MLKALIRFNDGSTQIGKGRIVDGKSCPWKDEEDVRSHIAYLVNKGYENMAVIKIWEEEDVA